MDYRKTLFLVVLMLVGVSSAFAQPTTTEVKASYIFKMAKFITWDGEKRQPIRFCYMEQSDIPKSNSVGQILAEYLKEKHGDIMTARRIRSINTVADCDILFLGADQEPNIADTLSRIQSPMILTIGDIRRFVQNGGMVNFTLDGNDNVKMEANFPVLQASRVRLSASILEMMTVYK